MPATRDTAARGKGKLLITAFLLVGLMVGLAACRGFFGQAPIALLTIAPLVDEEVPVEITCDISGSNDPDGTIASYEVDYGDDSTDTGTDVTDVLTHEYTVEGTYNVVLTITDNDGRIAMDTKTVTIGPVMITFASDRSGNYGIYRMQGDGSNEIAVRDTADDEFFPDLVRGTRRKIAYAAEDGTSWNIYSMTVEGTNNTPLTTQTPSNQIQPSWSYDGGKIAYASDETGNWEIYTMTATGATPFKLTTQTPSWAIAPAYSPVNDDLVFVSGVKHNGTATAGGSAIIKRTAAGTFSTLYDSTGNDGDASVAIAGFTPTLALPAGAGISKPAWSPDGTKIAFSTDKDTTAINIYVMNADGSGVEKLEAYVNSLPAVTTTVTAGSITSTDDECCPYWLEDESGLAFARKVGTAVNLYKVSFSDGAVTPLTSTTGNNVTPAARR